MSGGACVSGGRDGNGARWLVGSFSHVACFGHLDVLPEHRRKGGGGRAPWTLTFLFTLKQMVKSGGSRRTPVLVRPLNGQSPFLFEARPCP